MCQESWIHQESWHFYQDYQESSRNRWGTVKFWEIPCHFGTHLARSLRDSSVASLCLVFLALEVVTDVVAKTHSEGSICQVSFEWQMAGSCIYLALACCYCWSCQLLVVLRSGGVTYHSIMPLLSP